MKKILTVAAFVILIVFQISVCEHLKIAGISPNIVLAFTILISINSSALTAGAIGCSVGLALDALCYGVVGCNALIMLYISVGASVVASKFYSENIFVSAIFVLIFGFLFDFSRAVVNNIVYDSISVSYITLRYILPGCLYNFLVSLPLFYVVRWLKNEYIRGI